MRATWRHSPGSGQHLSLQWKVCADNVRRYGKMCVLSIAWVETPSTTLTHTHLSLISGLCRTKIWNKSQWYFSFLQESLLSVWESLHFKPNTQVRLCQIGASHPLKLSGFGVGPETRNEKWSIFYHNSNTCTNSNLFYSNLIQKWSLCLSFVQFLFFYLRRVGIVWFKSSISDVFQQRSLQKGIKA